MCMCRPNCASLLRSHGYKSKLHVISNGYESRFTPKRQRKADEPSPVPFRIVASGRLTNEKNHVALIRAIAAVTRRTSNW